MEDMFKFKGNPFILFNGEHLNFLSFILICFVILTLFLDIIGFLESVNAPK